MEISYNASGGTKDGARIAGRVIINSQSIVSSSLIYPIIDFKFSSCGSTYECARGINSDIICIPYGKTPDTVCSGNGSWKMGEWCVLTGAWFEHIDGSQYEEKLYDYMHLPPSIVLCCDNIEISSKCPFLPVGHLKLTWDPLFI